MLLRFLIFKSIAALKKDGKFNCLQTAPKEYKLFMCADCHYITNTDHYRVKKIID